MEVTIAFATIQQALDSKYQDACKMIAGTRSLFETLGSPAGLIDPPAEPTQAKLEQPAQDPIDKPARANRAIKRKKAGSVREVVLAALANWASAEQIKSVTNLNNKQIRGVLNDKMMQGRIERRDGEGGVLEFRVEG